MRWRENEETERRIDCVATRWTNGWWWWCCALHHGRTFDRDVDGVVHRAEPIPGGAAVISCVWFGHVHDAQGLLVVQEGCALGWEIAAHFVPGDFRGGPGFKERDKDKEWWWCLSRWALESFRADSFTYSPSAMHSISSTCPLNTILELEGPDGMRKAGFLSSAGSSIVTHKEKYYHLFCVRPQQSDDPGLNQTLHIHSPFFSALCGIIKTSPLQWLCNARALSHFITDHNSQIFMVGCKFYCHVVFYCSAFCECL